MKRKRTNRVFSPSRSALSRKSRRPNRRHAEQKPIVQSLSESPKGSTETSPLSYLWSFSFHAASQGQFFQKLVDRLFQEPTRSILVEFDKKKGDFRGLLWCVSRISPSQSLPLPKIKPYKTSLFRCLKSVDSLLTLYPLPDPVAQGAREFREVLIHALKVRFDFEKGLSIGRTKKGVGRPRGSATNEILSVLEKEFRLRFGGPRHKAILILAQTVDPVMFPSTCTPGHIRDRITKAPKERIEHLHKILFGSPPA